MLNIVCIGCELSQANSSRIRGGKIYLVIVSVCKFRCNVQSVSYGS